MPPPAVIPQLFRSLDGRATELHGIRVVDGQYPPLWPTPLHRHDSPGFGVLVQGALTISFRHRRHECLPGTIGATTPDEPHSALIGHDGAHIVAFEMTPTQWNMYGPALRFIMECGVHRSPAAISIARRVAVELHRPDAASGLVIEAAMLEILALAARSERAATGPGPPPWLVRAENLLHERFLESLSAVQLAQEVGVHPMHLARVFRVRFRTSIGLYVRRLRLDWAARQLAETDESLAQIALGAGFSDQSHFTRRFREHTGLTPALFRRTRQL